MYKLAVGDIVEVPVNLTLKEGRVHKKFSFTLTAPRVTQEELEEKPEQSVREFLLDNVTAWDGQRLVLNLDDSPAEFCRAAFERMLKTRGVQDQIWVAYIKETSAQAKN